ncbi:acyl carrier protein [Actinosynnema pretiosum subsp. pretiosum]|uniref:Acyl carrier protein n=1 Tax=Actinosynnema pretiosum subsp. pretiosum TaxID=103721 RepID=A0AA45L6A2_9PSEU|nr:acyl carrier protein [Actinosynnema pretiosum subsp. pretiosum]
MAGSTAGQLEEFWKELLDLPAVEPDDSFLGLGGNSLSAIMVANRVELFFGFRPSLELLLSSTFRELVEWCDRQQV